jgi:YidC/Oxa1 family membrane protein insertase
MDKNSIIGLLLIGGILLTFGLFNMDNADEAMPTAKVEQAVSKDSASNLTIVEPIETVNSEALVSSSLVQKLDVNSLPIVDSLTNGFVYTDTLTGVDTIIKPLKTEVKNDFTAETIELSNDKIKVNVNTKGAVINSVFLTEFKSYDDYVNEKESPLQLFDDKTSYGIEFLENGQSKNTKELNFVVSETKKDFIKLKSKTSTGSVEVSYTLNEGSYDVNYSTKFIGYSDADASKASLKTDIHLFSTEKHMPSEQRVSTIYFDEEGDYDYLSVTSDDEYELESKSNWVAYKQSFFVALLMKDGGFDAGSKMNVFKADEQDSVYLKQYTSDLKLGLNNMSNSIDLKWYFGPNDYDILALHKNGSEDIVDLGWGLFRWINVWFMRPLYKTFMGWGLGAGLAILLLTFIVKLVLSPVNYKMYKSSAMMKVLKPEIAEIQAKFPDKKDGMKKQQALMALYREAGASPMAGCVPMLIQMPILFAIFRLFPSAIEMRQKAFLWAEDLSTYDEIASWSTEVPLLSWAYGNHISLFTLLMAGTTLVYTHFNSSNMQQPTQEGMPNMKVIMYFFPFMMIFFFNSYSSGLSFYYFISTLMTMLIMIAIKHLILDEDKIHAKIQANKANPKKAKGKSKFAQRLEEAQKMQAQKAKGKK